MQIKHVVAKNFLSFRELDYILPESGLCFVSGEITGSASANSNGAGKSSLFEALAFGLYGKTIRGISRDEVINRDIKKNCVVTIELECDGDNYKISRYRNDDENGNSLFLFKGKQDLTGADSRVTQSEIEKVIGMEWLTFSTIVMFGQSAMRFAEAADAEKKKIFDEIMLFQLYQDAQAMAKEEAKVLQEKQRELEFNIGNIEASLQAFRQELEQLETKRSDFEAHKEQIEKEIKEKEKEIAELNRQFEEGSKVLKTIKMEIIGLEENDKAVNEVVGLVEKDRGVEMEDIVEKRSAIQSKLMALDDKIRAIETERGKVQSLAVGSKCPVCHQEIHAESREDILVHFEEELKNYNIERKAEAVEFEAQAIKEKEVRAKWEKKLNEAMSTKADVDAFLSAKRAESEGKLYSVTQLGTDIQVAQSRVDLLKGALTTQSQDLAKEKIRLGAIIDEKKEEMNSLQKGVEKNQEDQRYVDFWVTGFGNRGIKSLLLDEIIPQLNTQVNYYLSSLADEAIRVDFSTQTELKSQRGEMRDKFNIKVVQGEEATNYSNYSGGEQRRINVAILLAMQSLLFNRVAGKCSLIVFDEIFDILDKIGIERVVNLLKEEAKDKVIFAISHTSELGDFFDSSITVRNENGISTLEV